MTLQRLAPLVLLAGTLGALIGAVAAHQSPDGEPLPLAYTTCAVDERGDVSPVSWIRLDVVQSQDFPAVKAHELSHQGIINGFPTCQDYFNWQRHPDNARMNEGLAHCAHGRIQTAGGPLDYPRLARSLASYSDLGFTEASAEEYLRGLCR